MERVLQWLAGESLTRSSAAAAVATMALVLAAHLLLRWGVTRRWATTDTIAGTSSTVRPQDRHWLPWAVREVSPAVALLIWIQGLYVAFGLLLSAADPAAEGSRPDGSVAALVDGVDGVVDEARRLAIRPGPQGRAFELQTGQPPALSSDPETTFAPGQRINDVGREPIRRDGTDLAIAQPEEAPAHGREPGAPFQVDVNRAAALRG